MCGGTYWLCVGQFVRAGLSPRVRGNRGGGENHQRLLRSIPACAGEPRRQYIADTVSAVYPRVCGGTPPKITSDWDRLGLSPRVRGNRGEDIAQVSGRRSIPACAGEPGDARIGAPHRRVYPRVCGGTAPA